MIKNILLSAILFITIITAQPIREIIQPVNLSESNPVTVLLSDLFYVKDYSSAKFYENRFINVTYDKLTMNLTLSPKTDQPGLYLIEFTLDARDYFIPVVIRKSQNYQFTYVTKEKPETVNLFGQFNSWNRQNVPMTETEPGVFRVDIPLDPGRYEYKFFVDGKEIIDSLNPVYVPNGMGDYNSVIVIEQSAEDKVYLHNLGLEITENHLFADYFFDSDGKSDMVKRSEVIALLDNYLLKESSFSIARNTIRIMLDKKYLTGDHTLRVAVNKSGNLTNFQTLMLHNGLPVSQAGKRTHHDNVIYSIMIDRFYDGDTTINNPVQHPELSYKANYQGGDLQGIIDKIEEGYFNKLGVNTFWISPIVDNTNNAFQEYPAPHRYFTGYHGYWPVSSTEVEEKFGTLELAKELVKIAEDNGIEILLDFVANHVHEEHPLWKTARDWFGKLELPDGKLNLRLWDEQRLTTWFEPYMPSFDYEGSLEALEFMTDNAVWWLKETGAHGFRHDAVKHVPNSFWRTLTRKIKEEIEVPNNTRVYQIGETFGGFDLISSYVNNGQLSSQFNFNLYDVALPVFLYPENSFEMLDLTMNKTFQVYGVNHLMGNLADSHDKNRYMAYADGDLELNSGQAIEIGWTNPPQVDNPSSYDKLKIHLAYILTIPGVPVIYYGDEIGMTGAADPDNRRMMRFGDDLNYREKQNLEDVSNLIHLRKNHSALRYGDFYTLQADKNIYAYLRSDMNERIITVINKSEDRQKVDLKFPKEYKLSKATDLISGKEYDIKLSELSVLVDKIGYVILKVE
ncbi:MAG: alpha-glucosidase C-terminal domain-containing protein [Ignavibacterium sp.]|nr:alpha-glucosidase C-terminal domain-containing protein [Ignavibacterium sp.]